MVLPVAQERIRETQRRQQVDNTLVGRIFAAGKDSLPQDVAFALEQAVVILGRMRWRTRRRRPPGLAPGLGEGHENLAGSVGIAELAAGVIFNL